HADVVQELRGYVEQRWDFERLTADILRSQRRRNLIMRAVSRGLAPAWDFQPFEDATRMYYRGGGNWHEAEEREFLRFCPVGLGRAEIKSFRPRGTERSGRR